MGDDIKTRISMLERTILDLGTQLYELKGSFEKSKQDKEDLKTTITFLKNYLDKKGLLKKDDFDEELALSYEIENELIEDLPLTPLKGGQGKSPRRLKH